MKKRLLGALLVTLPIILVSVSSFTTAVQGAAVDDRLKGENKTGCVEVIEAKNGSSSCTDGKSITLRLKVTCEGAVDVRVCYKGKKGWQCRTAMDKKSGDEITLSECDATGPYVVYKRAAGTDAPFPNPK